MITKQVRDLIQEEMMDKTTLHELAQVMVALEHYEDTEKELYQLKNLNADLKQDIEDLEKELKEVKELLDYYAPDIDE